MKMLGLLKKLLDCEPLPAREISYDHFDKVVACIEKEEMRAARQLIESSFSEQILDIRLVFYFFYDYFLEEGVQALEEILPLIRSLATTYFPLLVPLQKKETHFQNSQNWFFSKVLQKLKHGERLSKTGKKSPFLQKCVEKVDENGWVSILNSLSDFHQFFYAHFPSSSVKEKVSHLVKRIEELKPVVEPLIQKEGAQQEFLESTQEAAASLEIQEEGVIKEQKIEGSFALEELIKKMELFEKLIEKKEYVKASLVAKDLSFLIENFDPILYFPKLFINYFSLMAQHVSNLSQEGDLENSSQAIFLEKLYKADREAFLNLSNASF